MRFSFVPSPSSSASRSVPEPFHRNKLFIRLRRPNAEERCRLGAENRIMYFKNYITKIVVDVNNCDEMCRKLTELCKQFNYNRGIYVDDSLIGYEQTAYEYFFKGYARFDILSPYHKMLLAQCIEAMYINRYDSAWKNVIDAVLMLLSSHGGRYSARAEALVNVTYDSLRRFLLESNIKHRSEDDTDVTIVGLFGDVFCNLKDDMVENARNNYLLEKANSSKPLNDCNLMVNSLRILLGIKSRASDDNYYYDTQRFLDMLTNKKYLIQKSHNIIDQSLNDAERDDLFLDIKYDTISFKQYCNFAGKSEEEIQTFRRAVEAMEDHTDTNYIILNSWIRGEHSLTLDDINDDNPGIL